MASYRNIRLHHLFDRIIPGSILLYPILWFLFLAYKIIRPSSDGWRKSTSVFHRKVSSRYVGAIKNLKIPESNSVKKKIDSIIEELYQVFSNMEIAKYAAKWGKWHTAQIKWEYTDFAKIEVSNNRINSLEFIPDTHFPLQKNIHPLVAFCERKVVELLPDINSNPQINWPWKFEKRLVKLACHQFPKIETQTINKLIKRVLSSIWITVSNPADDFAEYHFFEKYFSPGFGNFFINVVIKLESFDLWLQVNHISIDGRSSTELIKKIGKIFNQNESLPNSDKLPSTKIESTTVSIFNQKFDEGTMLVDLSEFLKIHKTFESQFGKINPVATLAWCVSSHPFFSKIKFNIPVDIPATRTKKRTVGFVFIRPDFFRRKYPFTESFKKYLDFFNTQFKSARKRKEANFIMVDSAAIVHPIILKLFFKLFPKSLEEVIGGLCLTLIKDIDIAIPPLSDNIYGGIVFTISNNPECHISNVGVKSSHLNSEKYLNILKELFSNLNNYLEV